MNITLYHYWRSSSSWRVRWAFEYKKLKYKPIAIDLLAGENERSAHIARNPLGFVPAVDINGEVYIESLPIIEWLEETMPSPTLYPGDPLQRLYLRGLTEVINSGTQPIQNLTVLEKYSDDENKRKEWNQYFIGRGLDAYETLARKTAGRFSVGDHFSVADLFLVPQCYNALRNDLNLERYPTISKIYQNCQSLPEYQLSHPDRFKPT